MTLGLYCRYVCRRTSTASSWEATGYTFSASGDSSGKGDSVGSGVPDGSGFILCIGLSVGTAALPPSDASGGDAEQPASIAAIRIIHTIQL